LDVLPIGFTFSPDDCIRRHQGLVLLAVLTVLIFLRMFMFSWLSSA